MVRYSKNVRQQISLACFNAIRNDCCFSLSNHNSYQIDLYSFLMHFVLFVPVHIQFQFFFF